jgi:chaperonin GroES
MKLKGGIVLIKAKQEEKVTDSGIVIPDMAVKDSLQGEVIAIGDGTLVEKHVVKDTGEVVHEFEKRPVDPAITIGCTVLYPRWAGNEIEYEGQQYLYVNERDLLAVLES